MKRIVSGLLLLALLSGCTSAAMQKTPEDSGRDAPLTVVQESMPEDFAVRFTWWYDVEVKRSFSSAWRQNKKRPSPSTVENSRIRLRFYNAFQ